MNQQWALKAKGLLGHFRQSIASRLREMIVLLCSAFGVLHSMLGSQYKGHMDILASSEKGQKGD